MKPFRNYRAYLVIKFTTDNRPVGAEVWSSPPWEQSMLPKNHYFTIAFWTEGESFQDALDRMNKSLLGIYQNYPENQLATWAKLYFESIPSWHSLHKEFLEIAKTPAKVS